jgi:predicted TIM-barrel fold metal-dependent hydrolase
VTRHGAIGFRVHATAAGIPLDDPRLVALMGGAATLGMTVCVLTAYKGLTVLPALLERVAEVPMALDHMGFPPLGNGKPSAVAHALFALARYPHVMLKFSSLNLQAAARGSAPEERLREAVDQSGPERLVWGSNFPAMGDQPLRCQLPRRTLAGFAARR